MTLLWRTRPETGVAALHQPGLRVSTQSAGLALAAPISCLSPAPAVAEAFTRMFYLDRACEIQLATLSAGQELIIPSPEVCEHAARQHDDYAYLDTVHLDREWTALLRLLERDGAAYRC